MLKVVMKYVRVNEANLPCYCTIKTYGGVEVWLHICLSVTKIRVIGQLRANAACSQVNCLWYVPME